MPPRTDNLDDAMEELIAKLKEGYGAASKVEVLRKALALLNMAFEAKLNGGDIAIVGPNKDIRRVLIA